MITCFSLPTTIGGALVTLAQPGPLLTPEFSCKENPVDGSGQAITTVLVVVRTTRNAGAPGVCTAAIMAQKPPSKVKLPPLMRPASAWPIVPVTGKTPPVLVPPPPSMLNQSIE